MTDVTHDDTNRAYLLGEINGRFGGNADDRHPKAGKPIGDRLLMNQIRERGL